MAKQAVIQRNKKRARLIKKYAAKRAELYKIMHDPNSTDKAKWKAQQEYQRLPVDSAPSRYGNRCELTGRKHGFYRKFNLSRAEIHKLARRGEIPGLVLSS